jgi:D-alanyl-D-alanine carboxypeptidase
MIKAFLTLLSLLQLQIPQIAMTASFNEASLLQIHSPFSRNEENIAPIIRAEAAIVMDADSGDILYAKNISEKLPIASLTKLMTTLIAVDALPQDHVVEITRDAFKYNGNGASTAGLRLGEKMDVNNLLHASLIKSGNDAAAALGLATSNGSLDDFVAKMNERTQVLGLRNTHFANPVGFDDADNYSTAYDLALIAKQAIRKPLLREIITKESYELRQSNGKVHGVISNTNRLFNSYLQIVGGKTGTTPQAGQCLFFVVKNDQGHEVLIVILNSPDRYGEAKVVADWVFRTYSWPGPKTDVAYTQPLQ